jgi:hypothetical protein
VAILVLLVVVCAVVVWLGNARSATVGSAESRLAMTPTNRIER